MCARFSLEIASTASQIYSGGIYLGWDGFVSVSLHPKYFWIIKNIWFGSTGFTASKKRIFVIFDNRQSLLAAQESIWDSWHVCLNIVKISSGLHLSFILCCLRKNRFFLLFHGGKDEICFNVVEMVMLATMINLKIRFLPALQQIQVFSLIQSSNFFSSL